MKDPVEVTVDQIIDLLAQGETANQIFGRIYAWPSSSTRPGAVISASINPATVGSLRVALAVIDRLHEMCSQNLIADLESGEFQVHGRLPAPLEEEIQDAISRAVRRARKKLLDGLIAADAVKSQAKVKR